VLGKSKFLVVTYDLLQKMIKKTFLIVSIIDCYDKFCSNVVHFLSIIKPLKMLSMLFAVKNHVFFYN